MSNYKKLVVSHSLIAIIHAIFDSRILQENSEINNNSVSRAIRIRDTKTNIISFIKRNPNSIFELIIPQFLLENKIRLLFNNFNEDIIDNEDDDSVSKYRIEIDESYTEAKVTHLVKVGKNIILTIRSQS